jgi:hypothetical protein
MAQVGPLGAAGSSGILNRIGAKGVEEEAGMTVIPGGATNCQ